MTHIILSRILSRFFPSKAFVLFLFQSFFEKFESGTLRIDPYCPFRKIWSTFIKTTYGLLLYFSNFFSKSWQRGNTVWPILPFQGSYIRLFQVDLTIRCSFYCVCNNCADTTYQCERYILLAVFRVIRRKSHLWVSAGS